MKDSSLVAARNEGAVTERHPFAALRRQMEALFDGFFDDFGGAVHGLQAFNPRVDVVENGKEVRISAELPGIEEKDVEVSCTNDSVTIRGEKREEKEEKGEERYRLERSYGAFRRTLALPCEVDAGKASATFKKGVLTVTLPKTAPAAKAKKVEIKAS